MIQVVQFRSVDIKSIYETGKDDSLMKKYNAHSLCGDAERERYEIQIPESGLEKLF